MRGACVVLPADRPGYGFIAGLLIEAVTGAHVFGRSRSPLSMVGFMGNAIGVLGSMLAAGLTIVGAWAARGRRWRRPRRAEGRGGAVG